MEDSAKVDFFVIDEFYKLHMEADQSEVFSSTMRFTNSSATESSFTFLAPTSPGYHPRFPSDSNVPSSELTLPQSYLKSIV